MQRKSSSFGTGD